MRKCTAAIFFSLCFLFAGCSSEELSLPNESNYDPVVSDVIEAEELIKETQTETESEESTSSVIEKIEEIAENLFTFPNFDSKIAEEILCYYTIYHDNCAYDISDFEAEYKIINGVIDEWNNSLTVTYRVTLNTPDGFISEDFTMSFIRDEEWQCVRIASDSSVSDYINVPLPQITEEIFYEYILNNYLANYFLVNDAHYIPRLSIRREQILDYRSDEVIPYNNGNFISCTGNFTIDKGVAVYKVGYDLHLKYNILQKEWQYYKINYTPELVDFDTSLIWTGTCRDGGYTLGCTLTPHEVDNTGKGMWILEYYPIDGPNTYRGACYMKGSMSDGTMGISLIPGERIYAEGGFDLPISGTLNPETNRITSIMNAFDLKTQTEESELKQYDYDPGSIAVKSKYHSVTKGVLAYLFYLRLQEYIEDNFYPIERDISSKEQPFNGNPRYGNGMWFNTVMDETCNLLRQMLALCDNATDNGKILENEYPEIDEILQDYTATIKKDATEYGLTIDEYLYEATGMKMTADDITAYKRLVLLCGLGGTITESLMEQYCVYQSYYSDVIHSIDALPVRGNAVLSEHFEINRSQFAIYFKNVFNENKNVYPVDNNRFLYDQRYSTTDLSLFDYFVNMTKERLTKILLFCEAAFEEGIVLDENDEAEIEQKIATIQSFAENYNMALDEFIKYTYKINVSTEDYRELLKLIWLANKYLYYLKEQYPTSDAYNAAYGEISERYASKIIFHKKTIYTLEKVY